MLIRQVGGLAVVLNSYLTQSQTLFFTQISSSILLSSLSHSSGASLFSSVGEGECCNPPDFWRSIYWIVIELITIDLGLEAPFTAGDDLARWPASLSDLYSALRPVLSLPCVSSDFCNQTSLHSNENE